MRHLAETSTGLWRVIGVKAAGLALCGLGVLLVSEGAVYAEEPPASQDPESIEASSAGRAPAVPEEAQGEQRAVRLRPPLVTWQRAHIDPETRTLMVPPSKRLALQLSPELEQALSTSHEGLVEGVMPNDTVVLHLQGRFHSMAFATLGEGGKTEISHVPTLLPAPQEDEGKVPTAEEERR